MLNRDRRAQFTILLGADSIEQGTEIRSLLSQQGYEVFLFTDEKSVIQRASESAPHVIVFHLQFLESDLNSFAELILQKNNEIQFIPIADMTEAAALMDYREFNFADFIPTGPEIASRTLWSVDQVCTQLYFLYQNEQLLKKNQQLIAEVEAHEATPTVEIEKPSSADNRSLLLQLQSYEECRSKEDLINQLYTDLNLHTHQRGEKLFSIYFKYLPTVHSFVATQGLSVDFENIKGVGSQLTEAETHNVADLLKMGQAPESLQTLMHDGFGVRDYTLKPLFVHRQLDGLFVFWTNRGLFQMAEFSNQYLLFSLMYQNLHLSKRNELLDINDPVTDLFNRDTYVKKLNEEIARARRLQKAVSVIKLSLDNYIELGMSLGDNNRDMILRSIAAMIRKSSRINDLGFRTQDNEISLILPHCARKGAALRAERLRRTIENHSFSVSGQRVTVSCGVSEYPSLSASATDLEVSSVQALNYIVERGGNKVCLFKPVDNFKPDFEVPPV